MITENEEKMRNAAQKPIAVREVDPVKDDFWDMLDDEGQILEKMKNIMPEEKLKILLSCFNDPNHKINKNCQTIIKEFEEICRPLVSEECLYEIYDEDLSSWIKGYDSLFEILIQSNKIEIPKETLNLRGLKIFPKDEISQTCKDQIITCPLCLASLFYNKKTVIFKYKKIIHKKLKILKNFQSVEGYGKVKWGMSLDQVLKTYPDAKREKDSLCSEGVIFDKKIKRYFIFIENKLILVKLCFLESYSSLYPENYVNDYKEIQKLLTDKYGQSQSDPFSEEKLDDMNLVDYMYLQAGGIGRAVRSGRMTLISTWETEGTEIIHSLVSKNDEIEHFIEYRSKELIQLKEIVEKRQLKDL